MTRRLWNLYLAIGLLRIIAAQVRGLQGLPREYDLAIFYMALVGLLVNSKPGLVTPKSLDAWYVGTCLLWYVALIPARYANVMVVMAFSFAGRFLFGALVKRVWCFLLCTFIGLVQLLWMARLQRQHPTDEAGPIVNVNIVLLITYLMMLAGVSAFRLNLPDTGEQKLLFSLVGTGEVTASLVAEYDAVLDTHVGTLDIQLRRPGRLTEVRVLQHDQASSRRSSSLSGKGLLWFYGFHVLQDEATKQLMHGAVCTADGGGGHVFFEDIRLNPFEATMKVSFEEYRGDSATSHVIFAVNVPDAPQIAQKMLASEVLGSLGGRLASEFWGAEFGILQDGCGFLWSLSTKSNDTTAASPDPAPVRSLVRVPDAAKYLTFLKEVFGDALVEKKLTKDTDLGLLDADLSIFGSGFRITTLGGAATKAPKATFDLLVAERPPGARSEMAKKLGESVSEEEHYSLVRLPCGLEIGLRDVAGHACPALANAKQQMRELSPNGAGPPQSRISEDHLEPDFRRTGALSPSPNRAGAMVDSQQAQQAARQKLPSRLGEHEPERTKPVPPPSPNRAGAMVDSQQADEP
eukprot:g10153.t1